MAQTRRYNKTGRYAYQYGSAARDYDVRQAMEQPLDEERRQQRRESAYPERKLAVLPALAVAVAFACLAMMMVNYVKLQSNLTATIKSVASKQMILQTMTSDNDEAMSRIATSVDLQQIEAIARGEMGMTHAQEGQIITYTSAANDYMRRVSEK